jgi:hypothetical protein
VTLRWTRARAVAALVAVALALSACGDSAQPAAAVVDGHRITQADLQAELDVVLTNPQVAEQIKGPEGEEARKDFTRRALYFLIQLQVVRGYAQTHGINVSAGEVSRQLAQSIRQVGGQQAFRDELRRRGLSLSAVRENIEQNLLLTRVEDAVAGPAVANDQQRKNAAFARWLQQRLGGRGVQVNPRFGRLDAAQQVIVPITSTQA